MGKQLGRGWYVHDFAWSCFNCCCSVCTAENCPYPQHWGAYKHRCAECVQRNGQMRKCLECDFFVNKYTKPIRFKVVRRWHREGEIEKRLDAIMVKLEIDLPEDSPAAGKHNYIDPDASKLIHEYNQRERLKGNNKNDGS